VPLFWRYRVAKVSKEKAASVRVCHFQWRRGRTAMFLCNAASGLCKSVEVSQFLHNLEQLGAMPYGFATLRASPHCA